MNKWSKLLGLAATCLVSINASAATYYAGEDDEVSIAGSTPINATVYGNTGFESVRIFSINTSSNHFVKVVNNQHKEVERIELPGYHHKYYFKSEGNDTILIRYYNRDIVRIEGASNKPIEIAFIDGTFPIYLSNKQGLFKLGGEWLDSGWERVSEYTVFDHSRPGTTH